MQTFATRISLMLAMLACATCCLTLIGQENNATKDPTRQANRDQIREWIRQLDSESFIQRETATEKLIDAGASSIPAIVGVLPQSSRELATRAIHVLRELALVDDEETETKARDALVRIATVRRTLVGRRAAETLNRLDELRQNRAIAKLEKLGAEINNGDLNFQQMLGPIFALQIANKWTGEAKDLRSLKWLGDVRYITLKGASITDDYVKHVAAMENLRFILIKHAKVTDAGIGYLTRLKNLELIDVRYTPITDKSIEYLSVHPQIGKLNLYGTAMTEEGAQTLVKALADANAATEVDYKHGAFLGVGCETNERGCEIAILAPNSSAAKVGLQVGDIITKYDEKKVVDFEQLRKMIAKHQAGESVAIEVLRGEETFSKTITLGEWD